MTFSISALLTGLWARWQGLDKSVDNMEVLSSLTGPDILAQDEHAGRSQPRALWTQPSFLQALTLERKRTERSRKPFLLVLLDLARARTPADGQQLLVRQVHRSVTSFMRETDVIGWYRTDSIVGAIFTELGTAEPQAAMTSISGKIRSALRTHAGPDAAALIGVSCYLFPDGWSATRPREGKALFYPEESAGSHWLQSTSKRVIDITGSIIALLLFSPLLVLIAALVKLTSKGPVLFRQIRVGQHGNHFRFLKFRSMYVDNSSRIHENYVKELIRGGHDIKDDGVFKIQNDPRVTFLGHILRKSSLDELPQFWNALKGEMSLVGPRPAVPYEVDLYDLWHRRRLLQARPGITGLWQVTGRSRTTFDNMVRLDLRYSESSSFWLDTKILLQTPIAVVLGSGAY